MTDAKLREERETRSGKEQTDFIQLIADRLGRPVVKEAPAHPFRGAPPFWREYKLPLEDRIHMFMTNWTTAGGHAVRLANSSAVRQFVLDFCRETDAASIIVQDQEELQELRLGGAGDILKYTVWNTSKTAHSDLVSTAAFADVGLAVADYAAAYTGSIVVSSSDRMGRSTSLLPKVFMVIVPIETITTRLGEIMSSLEQYRAGEDIPAGIHFISGPSRSADIENDLTIGVHGPGIVYALIVG